ncbi:MAG: hypothetical protein LUQ09_04530 [Methanomassiliicoccales archaeon]|nr:hypothetical protein [Methanomassiliicoccales archaeon]
MKMDTMETIGGIVSEMQPLVLIFGIVISAVGFFKGAYPKGSYSRLTFATAVAILTILYVWSLLLGGGLQEAVNDEIFELDLMSLFMLYMVGALFNTFLPLAEFIDHRHAWLERSEQVAPREKESADGHLWYHDFHLRYGSMFNGIVLSRRSANKFVIVPLIVIILLKAGLTSLDIDEIDALTSSLDDAYYVMLYLGLAITAISFFKGFYPKGSFSRFLPALIVVLISMYWVWTIGLEGKFVIDAADVVTFTLDYTGILLLMVCGTGLWGVYYAVELWTYRREWKEGGFQKDALEGEKKKKKVKRERKSKPTEEPIPPQQNVQP